MSESVLAAQLYTLRDFTQTLPEIAKTLKINILNFPGTQRPVINSQIVDKTIEKVN